MVIQHNLSAMNANRMLGINTNSASKSMEKLSSGYRINRAGDDAAGLSISEKMRAQINGLTQASRNSEDGVSLIQTAEGALNETHSILQRMRELAVQSSSDTNVTVDRSSLNDEMNQLISEVNRIGKNTQFNEQNVISKQFTARIQVGANASQYITLTWKAQTTTGLGEDGVDISTQSVSTQAKASAAISRINSAIVSVSKSRSKMGALQNRLEHTVANLDNSAENLQSAESRVRDVDMAKEMMQYSKSNVLTQAAQAMLSQANQTPQSVLSLLK